MQARFLISVLFSSAAIVWGLGSVAPPVPRGHVQAEEATGTPTPRPPIIVARVTNDLNANGRRDEGEPGLPGWEVTIACSDALLPLPPTDGTGVTAFEGAPSDRCILVSMQFGWLPTSPSFVDFAYQPGARVEIDFLVRRVGERVQRVTGHALVQGLPASASASLAAEVGGQSCGDVRIDEGYVATRCTLYILSAQDRPGCAADGQPVAILLDGQQAAAVAFAPGTSVEVDLSAGPVSMWFSMSPPAGVTPDVYVGDLVCGEARKYTGAAFVPQNLHYVYVLPEDLRHGCGAPGRTVTLRAGTRVLQTLRWQAGHVIPGRDVLPPETGTGSLARGKELRSLAALTFASASALALGLAYRLRRGRA